MIETEAKIRLDESEFQGLYGRLGSPDFVLQRNWGYFFKDSLIRVREEGKKKYLTLKRSRQEAGKYNSREEIEFEISDTDLARKVFQILEVDEYYYEKERATRKISGCVVCLDRILGVGDFIEVEGEAADIQEVLETFGLNHKSIERRNYFQIIADNGLH